VRPVHATSTYSGGHVRRKQRLLSFLAAEVRQRVERFGAFGVASHVFVHTDDRENERG